MKGKRKAKRVAGSGGASDSASVLGGALPGSGDPTSAGDRLTPEALKARRAIVADLLDGAIAVEERDDGAIVLGTERDDGAIELNPFGAMMLGGVSALSADEDAEARAVLAGVGSAPEPAPFKPRRGASTVLAHHTGLTVAIPHRAPSGKAWPDKGDVGWAQRIAADAIAYGDKARVSDLRRSLPELMQEMHAIQHRAAGRRDAETAKKANFMLCALSAAVDFIKSGEAEGL